MRVGKVSTLKKEEEEEEKCERVSLLHACRQTKRYN